jgi:hypothetical protein
MRQVITLQQYYTNAYSGYLPFNYGFSGPFPWRRPLLDIPGRLRINFMNGIDSEPPYDPEEGEGPLESIHFGSWFVLLAELAENNYGIFWCPGKPPNMTEDRPDYGQSFVIATLCGDGIYRGPGNFDISRAGLNETRIRRPSELLIYADGAVDDRDEASISFSMRLAQRKGQESLNLLGPGNWHPSLGGSEGSFVGGHHSGSADVYDRVLYWNEGPLAPDLWVNE